MKKCEGRPYYLRLVLFLLLILMVSPLFAQRKVTIKMASPIPENTPWGRFFNQMSADWKRITNGEVELIVYHDRSGGSEKEVVRKLKVGQFQAAVLSTFGLYEISPEIITLSCPFLIRDDDELDMVIAGLKGELEEKISGKGYFTLAWARVGWVKFISKSPIFVPADLKRQKLGTYPDQSEMNQAFKSMGFQMIPIPDNILVALTNNTVDAVFQSILAVGSTQVFGVAKNMASINVAPFVGTVIIDQRTWRSVPDKYKPQLIDAVRRNEAALDRSIRQLEDDMIKTMGNYGLKVNQLSPDQEQLWYSEMGRAVPNLVGNLYDRGVYQRIEAMLQERRNGRR